MFVRGETQNAPPQEEGAPAKEKNPEEIDLDDDDSSEEEKDVEDEEGKILTIFSIKPLKKKCLSCPTYYVIPLGKSISDIFCVNICDFQPQLNGLHK